MNKVDDHKLTKGERYLLKKQQKEQERLYKVRREKIKKITIISFSALLIIGGIAFVLANYSQPEQGEKDIVEAQGTPKIEIDPLRYDAGTVSMADGLVKYTYEIENQGDGALKIDRIWTSCMCTTARLRVGDKESPEFGMHTGLTSWFQEIAPGEKGFLDVAFDSTLHGLQGIGENIRAIYLSTNDPQNKKAEVMLRANVTR